ncbi:uncharacterized protein LOC114350470, partial [Ostrinia furnacalis]
TYTLLETDGTKRVVEYEADDKNGFNAIVHKIGTPKEHEEYKPQKHYEEYKPQKHFEEYKPQYHEFNNFEDGFVPVAGGFEH